MLFRQCGKVAESAVVTGGSVAGSLAIGLCGATKAKEGMNNDRQDDISYSSDISDFTI